MKNTFLVMFSVLLRPVCTFDARSNHVFAGRVQPEDA